MTAWKPSRGSEGSRWQLHNQMIKRPARDSKYTEQIKGASNTVEEREPKQILKRSKDTAHFVNNLGQAEKAMANSLPPYFH